MCCGGEVLIPPSVVRYVTKRQELWTAQRACWKARASRDDLAARPRDSDRVSQMPASSPTSALRDPNSTAQSATEEDISRASRPSPLFHYTSASIALDHILMDARLRLGPPTRLNDPYESGLVPLFVEIDVPRGEHKRPDPEETRERVAHESEVYWEANRLLRSRCRVLCLTISTRYDSFTEQGFGNGYVRPRMWAQYADNHTGVCLAFDQERLRDSALRLATAKGLAFFEAPVVYEPEGKSFSDMSIQIPPPPLDATGFVDDLFPTLVDGMYFRKAWDWATESEYRYLVYGDAGEYEYVDISGALTAIFCGYRFPGERLNDLGARCPQLLADGRIYTLGWWGGVAKAWSLSTEAGREAPAWVVPPHPDGH